MTYTESKPGQGHSPYPQGGERESSNGGSARKASEKANTNGRRELQAQGLRGNGSRPNQPKAPRA